MLNQPLLLYIFGADILPKKVDVFVTDKNLPVIVPPDAVIFPVVETTFPVFVVISLIAFNDLDELI